ncbi:spore maturation protein SpmB [Sphingomonas sp. SORGH_AS870]|nr:spore maturation protein SpmB [Sphingomonas sp. SORGH_AS_0870]
MNKWQALVDIVKAFVDGGRPGYALAAIIVMWRANRPFRVRYVIEDRVEVNSGFADSVGQRVEAVVDDVGELILPALDALHRFVDRLHRTF